LGQADILEEAKLSMSEKISLRQIIGAILSELKALLKEYINEAETAFKKRLKRLLIISIISSVLMTLGISLIGSASQPQHQPLRPYQLLHPYFQNGTLPTVDSTGQVSYTSLALDSSGNPT
jgi:hypothetical protein